MLAPVEVGSWSWGSRGNPYTGGAARIEAGARDGRRPSADSRTSLKPLLGHCLGASAAVEAVATALAQHEGFVPSTLGTEEVDGKFRDLRVVTRRIDGCAGPVLPLAEGFGGRCVALLFARLEETPALRSTPRGCQLWATCGP